MSKQCLGCKKRTPGCHAKCEDYKEWKKQQDERRRLIRKNKYEHRAGIPIGEEDR